MFTKNNFRKNVFFPIYLLCYFISIHFFFQLQNDFARRKRFRHQYYNYGEDLPSLKGPTLMWVIYVQRDLEEWFWLCVEVFISPIYSFLDSLTNRCARFFVLIFSSLLTFSNHVINSFRTFHGGGYAGYQSNPNIPQGVASMEVDLPGAPNKKKARALIGYENEKLPCLFIFLLYLH